MDTFIERLTLAMQAKKIKPAELSRGAGISKGTVSKYLSEPNKQHDFEIIIKIAKFLDVTPEWLGGITDERRPFDMPTIMEVYNLLSATGQKEAFRYVSYLLEKERESEGGE